MLRGNPLSLLIKQGERLEKSLVLIISLYQGEYLEHITYLLFPSTKPLVFLGLIITNHGEGGGGSNRANSLISTD